VKEVCSQNDRDMQLVTLASRTDHLVDGGFAIAEVQKHNIGVLQATNVQYLMNG
jgi:hypothetical protein